MVNARMDNPAMTGKVAFFYIVEPPDYQIMACDLLASIRTYFGEDVQAIGYCPEHRMDELHPAVFKAHEMMNAEIRPMRTEGMWDTPYPHGNKIIAALQPRDTAYSAFLDSDILFLRPNRPENLFLPGHVSCSKAASMMWADASIWKDLYEVFDMDVPEERMSLMRRRKKVPPYFSSGLVGFPETLPDGRHFGQVWYDCARQLDRAEHIPKRRPYLDQMTLPVAIRKAGLMWNILPEEQHFILGGRLKGKPLPEDREIFTVHYRTQRVLRDAGLYDTAKRMLKSKVGVRYVRRLVPDDAQG
ncbi:MAG: hypothetical protein R3E47_06295 [Paracoccaceae bacterium]